MNRAIGAGDLVRVTGMAGRLFQVIQVDWREGTAVIREPGGGDNLFADVGHLEPAGAQRPNPRIAYRLYPERKGG